MKKFLLFLMFFCGFTGVSWAEIKCGHECNKDTIQDCVFCDGNFWCCGLGSGGYKFVEEDYFKKGITHGPICDYIDPETMNKPGFHPVWNFFDNFSLYDNEVAKVEDGVVVEVYFLRNRFCAGCKPGLYFYPNGDGFSCTPSKDQAWCHWKEKEGITIADDTNRGCKCVNPKLTWDKKEHDCVAGAPSSDSGASGGCSGARCHVTVPGGGDSGAGATSGASLPHVPGTYTAPSSGDNIATMPIALSNAIENIDRFFESAKSDASVWKNADGGFNTARLASDATAGVVLGTVGGIVSAHVIKKKQLEKGFDALQCTIGKQKVADFGDEFTVGLGK